MALNKQPVTLNFSQGVETKTDPFQVPFGKFLSLQNSVFTTGDRLQKRNGFGTLSALPDSSSTYLTTFNQDLTAIGTSLFAYASPTRKWVEQSAIQPLNVSTLSLIKNNTNQSQAESAIAPNGYICTVYTDQNPATLADPISKFVVADAVTGQNIIAPTVITNADSTYGIPRIFLLSTYFIVVYSTAANHLEYIAISVANPSNISTPATITTSYAPSDHGLAFDGAVSNNAVYFAWNGAASSGIKMNYLTNHLSLSSTITPDGAHLGDIVSVCADPSNGTIWVAYYGYVANTAYALARSQQLNAIRAATLIIPSPAMTHVANLTGIASNSTLTFWYEIAHEYSYDSIASNYIQKNTLPQSGSLGTAAVVMRSVGLASQLFEMNSEIYALSVYQSPYQSTYFLINQSSQIVAKLAYQNAGGYLTFGLPPVCVSGSTAQVPYLIKDLIQAANTATNVSSSVQVAGIYSQTGINLASFAFGTDSLVAAEIGTNLNLTGGFLWAYDGYSLTENNFFVYPDSVQAVSSGTSGVMTAQKYYYQVTYEWSDNQGNLFRSAPSLPVTVTLTSDTSVDVSIPTLRLSLKNVNNPVKLVIYRWSAGQPVYYQVTSIAIPLLNDPTTDDLTYNDGLADSGILGNNILYTNGGVLENVGPPAFDSVFDFDSRLWGIVSEDKNLLWFSKPVIEGTPVEMTDLQTLFISPSIGAQGPTGPLRCGAAMDDKLILFKQSAMNYVSGTGPDSTGANNAYSPGTFITSTVGCSNQKSIIFQPQGLMFEFASESGNQIWLLGRNLSTQYIGASVEAYTTNATVLSAVNIPGTNQVRFTLSSGITLMYDYYYGQWGTFVNVPAVSSVLYQGLHTYINSLGQVFQETPNLYLDGTNPVLMSFSSSWINLASLIGYQRAYFFYLLGTYLSPHLLNLQIAYDYNPAVIQQTIIQPDNYNPNYGVGYIYGSQRTYGGMTNLEQWKTFLTVQRCQSFQISLTEIYDPSFGVAAGAGFTLSGLNIIVGLKKGYRPTKFVHQAGGSS